MAFKTGFLLLLLGIFGIFEVQAASIPTENDMWMNIDEGLPFSLLFYVVLSKRQF